jgi:hypothetical protein
MEGEEAIILLESMFGEYQLDEYKPAFEALKADWERICRDNFNFRTGGKKDAAVA